MGDYVVLASGSGTNFEAIARDARLVEHRLVALIADNPRAYALQRAETLNVASVVVNYAAGRKDAEDRLARVLDALRPDIVVLAGFMKVLTPTIVDRFPGRIVNIHPSILPSFPGLHAIERSFADPRARMGITIHLVDHGVDTGPVLEQHEARRDGDASLGLMEERIHALEHEHYPRAIAGLLADLGRLPTESS